MTFGWGAIFSLLTLILGGGGAIVTWIKILPRMKELANAKSAVDYTAMADRIGKLEKRVDEANAHAQAADDRTHVVQMQMVSMNAAFQLVASELQRRDPANEVLKQARSLIAQAATQDNGIGNAMRELSRLPGTRDRE